MKAATRIDEKVAPKKSSGRLVGWLVSYENDAEGEQHELRSGRILISSTRDGTTRRSTISIDEADISSPHAALLAKRDHVVVIQDIFSDHGTFICRAGSKKEEPVRGPIEVEHGDWIRFGKTVRFQVCLIDGRRG